MFGGSRKKAGKSSSSTTFPPATSSSIVENSAFGSGSQGLLFALRQPLPPPPALQPQQKASPAQPQLQTAAIAALQSSLLTGIFADSQFHLYSRRARDGDVDRPLPIHASSAVLMQTAEYFQNLLTGGFSEDVHIGLHLKDARQPASRKLRRSIPACDYEYESDSDLDDEIDDAFSSRASETPAEGSSHQDASVGTDTPILDPRGIKTHEGVQSGRATSVSSDTTDGWKDEGKAVGPQPPSDQADDYESAPIPEYIIHTVVIQDIAYRTFRAFVHYTYTGSIEFSTLRSLEGLKPATDVSDDQACELACSPKSMYRLADKYGLSKLKELAAQNIKSQLTSEIAFSELLSRFTARYPQIMNLEIDFICAPGKTPSGSLTNLEEWMDRVVTGELPHAGPALVALIRKLGLRS